MMQFGLPKGIVVNRVADGSPAKKAGIKKNDIITKVNGTAVTQASEFTHIIQKCSTGSKPTLTVCRQGTILDLTVTVIEKEQSALGEQNTSGSSAQQQSTQKLPRWFGY